MLTDLIDPNAVHAALRDEISPALRFRGGINFGGWQAEVRAKLEELIRIPHLDAAPEMKMEIAWEREHSSGAGTVARIHLTTEPHVMANGYLCLPAKSGPPYPWMICLQGHSSGAHLSVALDQESEMKEIEVPGDRDFARQAMRHGWAALCLEQRGFGERMPAEKRAKQKTDCHAPAMHALLLGRTIIGERLLDVKRAIELIKGRDDFDGKNLGIMGNSSGGTTAMYTAALFPELSAVMPSCSFCTFAGSLLGVHHCVCNYIPGLYSFVDMPDILGCFAPKPAVIVQGTEDDLFPIRETEKAFGQLQEIYAAAGAPDNCRLLAVEGGHRFYAEQAWPVFLEMTSK